MIARDIGHVVAGQACQDNGGEHGDGSSTKVETRLDLLRLIRNGLSRLMPGGTKARRDLSGSSHTP